MHKRCVNPSHLAAKTPGQHMADTPNARGKQQARKTHCRKGHPYAGENLYTNPVTCHRQCRACMRVLDARRRGPRPPHYQLRKTHCAAGHPFSGENLYLYGPERKYRGCRACRRAAKDRLKARAR